jgi:aerobic carbon-monoxide dehydrogenase small subunit
MRESEARSPAAAPRLRLHCTVNGTPVEVDYTPAETLLEVLRRLGWSSVRRGCDEGDCGSCSILYDGALMRACLLYAGQAEGRTLTTVESLGTARQPHPIQQAFVDAGAVQCGYCTPGMVLATHALLAERPAPTDAEIRDALDGNLCRCTGYVKILDAVVRAASRSPEGGAR